MKITVCQLHNGRNAVAMDWDGLVEHVKTQRSDLVLLPEMPFYPWFPTPREFDAGVWQEAVTAHESWERRLSELAPAVALATRPVNFGAFRYCAGFKWNLEEGIAETVHVKSCLSNEDGSWETTWFERATPDFEGTTIGAARVGMLIGLELWMSDQARYYGNDGVHIIAIPRVDRSGNSDIETANNEWLEGGRAAARASGAYVISSSRGARSSSAGGTGWIIAPDGQTVASTTADEPFVTAAIDLAAIIRKPREVQPLGMPPHNVGSSIRR
jgi:predicted amidohydrolase